MSGLTTRLRSPCTGTWPWTVLARSNGIAKAALRLTVGAMKKAPAVVLDGIDVLTLTHRGDAIDTVHKIARKTGMAVLLTESVAGRELPK